MIPFKQHISESLSSSYPYSLVRDRELEYIRSRRYEFRDGNNILYNVKVTYEKVYNQLDVDFEANSSMRASGNAESSVKVFGTIGKILEGLLKEYPGASISFAAIDGISSRVRLYDALAKRLAGILGKHVNKIKAQGLGFAWEIK
ncbi:hypothetical protein EVB91_139 [Rhizobium phage RHph_I1_18]|nr:hypothetical protein EVB91_139 [Rhizobium phage RHph_I1_18]